MREYKFSITLYLPDLARISWEIETVSEVKKRTLRLHQKFSANRKQLDLEFKRKKIDISKYHRGQLQLSQDQFAYSFFASWRRVFLTLDGKRKTVLAVIPS